MANAINDATKVIDAVTTIVNQVNTIVEEDLTARDASGGDEEVSAQSGSSDSNETLTERVRAMDSTAQERDRSSRTSRRGHVARDALYQSWEK